ncbi:hypothetical protein ACIBI8_36685 [Streptomyces sp. NPDC050529]|nr:hypothetical protein [Streptomyces sp. NBC_01022]WRZ78875.1 hypothetical protein OG316_00660 [Streptomyces sp. NBC_01022]WRZ86804.1 hypothetical protein OG316_44235 [Streptomyces sp. NBC_01022]
MQYRTAGPAGSKVGPYCLGATVAPGTGIDTLAMTCRSPAA